MSKSISALVRRADLTREEFHRYYEESHAPLASRYFPFRGYVRYHFFDAPDIGFDTISEFWSDDLAAAAGLMAGPVGEIMRADEGRFMDSGALAAAGAEELVVSHTLAAAAGDMRTVVLIDWSGDDETIAGRAEAWARGEARACDGSLDRVIPWQQPLFPARLVLWAPAEWRASTPVPSHVMCRPVQARRCATTKLQSG